MLGFASDQVVARCLAAQEEFAADRARMIFEKRNEMQGSFEEAISALFGERLLGGRNNARTFFEFEQNLGLPIGSLNRRLAGKRNNIRSARARKASHLRYLAEIAGEIPLVVDQWPEEDLEIFGQVRYGVMGPDVEFSERPVAEDALRADQVRRGAVGYWFFPADGGPALRLPVRTTRASCWRIYMNRERYAASMAMAEKEAGK